MPDTTVRPTEPIDVVSKTGEWLATFRYEPYIDKWFVVRPNASSTISLLDTKDLPQIIANKAQSWPAPEPLIQGAYSAPIKLQIQLNKNCNYSCVSCYAESYRGRAEPDQLGFEELTALFAEAKKWGILKVTFVGGEVFMRKDFTAIAEAAMKQRLLVSIITNARIPGSLSEIHGPLISSLFNVQVSCNGLGESYEREYGADWPEARVAIANVLRLSRSNILSYVIKEENVEDIPAFFEFAAETTPTVVKFGTLCWSGRGRDGQGPYYYSHVLPRAKKLIEAGRAQYAHLNVQSQLDFGAEQPEWEESLTNYRPKEFYYAPESRDGVYIGSTGDVYPFPLLSDRPQFRIGNIRVDSMKGLWSESELLHSIREVTFESSECGRIGCERVCGLWGRSYAIAWSGRLDGKVPCELTNWMDRPEAPRPGGRFHLPVLQ